MTDRPSRTRDPSELAPTPDNENERIAALHALQILDTLPDERFERIVRLAAAHFSMPVVRISFVDEDRVWFKAYVGLTVSQAPRDISICSHAILDSETMVVTDLTADPRFADSPQVVDEPKFRFYAGAPITLDGDLSVGVVCLMDTVPHPEFSEADTDFLSDLAEIVVHELEAHRQLILRGSQLETSDKALAAARGAKSRFMAIIGHELRTPLHLIIGFGELLTDEPHGALGDARYMEYASQIGVAAERLDGLIGRVLDYASAEATELQIQETEFALEPLMRICSRALIAGAAVNDVRIAVNVNASAPTQLYADEIQISEIIYQLALNAVTHSPQGSLVRLRAHSNTDGQLVITVLDRGSGVSPERIEHILSAFTQDCETLSRPHGGLGLGLPLAKTLTELHGGVLTLGPRAGGGAQAEVTFPAFRSRGGPARPTD